MTIGQLGQVLDVLNERVVELEARGEDSQAAVELRDAWAAELEQLQRQLESAPVYRVTL